MHLTEAASHCVSELKYSSSILGKTMSVWTHLES